MKKVLFFIHNGWVFGKIHNELIKALYPDVYCDILCWNGNYSKNEIEYIKDKYDLFLSTPEGCCALFDRFSIPLERMVAVLHQDYDIFNPLKNGMPKEYVDKFAGYAAIAPLLQNISLSHGIGRVPDLLRVGTFQSNYPKNNSDKPSRIGSFAKFSRKDQGFDVKRGNLIEQVANKSSIAIVKNEGINFLGAEKLYREIDLVVSPSLVEGNPYPMLEAFSCGIPYLGTPVGIAQEYLKFGGGKLMPLQADDFVFAASYEIEKMKADRIYYRKLADESFEIGKMIDWSNLRNEWINFFNKI